MALVTESRQEVQLIEEQQMLPGSTARRPAVPKDTIRLGPNNTLPIFYREDNEITQEVQDTMTRK